MNEKIRPEHRERIAYVYMRQAATSQIRNNLDSQKPGHPLVERAREWRFRDVVVIDDDPGRSACGEEQRPGFARLLAAVCEGVVGAVFASDASRLARDDREWQRLIDLCALTDTLVVLDHDRIYDPKQYNHRLLLGIRSTFFAHDIDVFRESREKARHSLSGAVTGREREGER